jgi:hypothetical protein
MTRDNHDADEAEFNGADDAGVPGEVHSITSAAPGHSVDMHQRMVRYAVAMGIRMVCIVALFFLDGWFKLVAVAGAVFLPWVAVVIANAQTKADTYDSELLDHISYGELGSGYVEDTGADWAGDTIPGETIPGETVDDAEPAREDHRRPDSSRDRRPEEGAA